MINQIYDLIAIKFWILLFQADSFHEFGWAICLTNFPKQKILSATEEKFFFCNAILVDKKSVCAAICEWFKYCDTRTAFNGLKFSRISFNWDHRMVRFDSDLYVSKCL